MARRRRERRCCTAASDVNPPRLLELAVGLLLRLPDRSGRDETRAWPHVLQKIGGWQVGGVHELAREDQGAAVHQLGGGYGAVILGRGPYAQ
jgi:hypothetical protein